MAPQALLSAGRSTNQGSGKIPPMKMSMEYADRVTIYCRTGFNKDMINLFI